VPGSHLQFVLSIGAVFSIIARFFSATLYWIYIKSNTIKHSEFDTPKVNILIVPVYETISRIIYYEGWKKETFAQAKDILQFHVIQADVTEYFSECCNS
jgi:hypothetical protein